MNLPNTINDRLTHIKNEKAIGLMTHTVIGYPSLDESRKLVPLMSEEGADFIELQIPFSDPTADGATIMTANHVALEQGIRLTDCMRFMEEMSGKVSSPLLFITYANIPFRYGMEAFCRDAANAGAKGIIVPDLPYDDAEGLFDCAKAAGLHAIPVISEVIPDGRLTAIDGIAESIIYATSRMGTTGSKQELSDSLFRFLSRLKRATEHPVAVGFGISKIEHVTALVGHADIAVIGSHILNIFTEGGENRYDLVRAFLRSIALPKA